LILFSKKRKENQESPCSVRPRSASGERFGGRFESISFRIFSDWKNHDEHQKASFGFAQDKFWAIDGGFEGGGEEKK